MTAPIPPQPEPWPPPASRPTAVVGGLPWAQPSTPSTGPLVVVTEPRGEAAAEPEGFSWPEMRRRVEAAVQKSPAFSVSLSLHVLLLLMLALLVVRRQRQEQLTLEATFSVPRNETPPDAGMELAHVPEPPQPEPVERTEVVEIDLPPVEDPVAAPVVPLADGPGPQATPAKTVPIGMALDGRETGRKKALVKAFGGTAATEGAVGRALEWLDRQQNQKDGLWSLQGPYADGGSQENRLAATAMALLAYQGAGNTLRDGPHRKAVARGWRGLLAKQTPEGNFDTGLIPSHHQLYSHAQATIAICEIYGMTKDDFLARPAARALAYALAAQGPNGGWRYEPGTSGDMSVTGWYLMALKTAEMAGLAVPPAAFEGITRFLDLVANETGTRYGYRREFLQRPASPVTPAVSAEGLLSRQYLGWPPNDPRILEGLEWLVGEKPLDYDNDKDFYAWYYITQVAHHAQGDIWSRWNERMRDVLPARQVAKGREHGSWDPALDKWGHIGGRLYTTCLAAFMLEVYYRHLPLTMDPAIDLTASDPKPQDDAAEPTTDAENDTPAAGDENP